MSEIRVFQLSHFSKSLLLFDMAPAYLVPGQKKSFIFYQLKYCSHVISSHFSYASCHVHVMSCHVMSCHVMSCHVMSCHVMSCHVMSCHVMSCHVMSYIKLHYATLCYDLLCHIMSSCVIILQQMWTSVNPCC